MKNLKIFPGEVRKIFGGLFLFFSSAKPKGVWCKLIKLPEEVYNSKKKRVKEYRSLITTVCRVLPSGLVLKNRWTLLVRLKMFSFPVAVLHLCGLLPQKSLKLFLSATRYMISELD